MYNILIRWFRRLITDNTVGLPIIDHAIPHPESDQPMDRSRGNASTLYSNLEKNQELKNILLEETPWVLAADNETEQKQRLSLLFDLNRADGLREAALQQLIQQQNEEGGWSWFKGFPASRAITLSILKDDTACTAKRDPIWASGERDANEGPQVLGQKYANGL